MSSYYNVYKAVKPFAKIAGQKTVKGVKAAAKKAKMAVEKFDVDQKYKAAKNKLNKTFEKTDEVLKKLGDTINKNK
tara:strand:- start:476 stop:703 length:228 start_codon:yes stop_codon:yes gene_type:complete